MTPLTRIAQLVSGVVFFKRRRSTRHLSLLMLICSSFAEVFLESLFPASQPALCRMRGSFLQVAARPWFWLGGCWHRIIAQEYSSLSRFISLTLSTRNESFTLPQPGDLFS